MKPMTPMSCKRHARMTFSSMPALTACRALCSRWFAGPNRYLKKSIRVGRDGISGRRGSSPISMYFPGFCASNAGLFRVLKSPSARLNRRDLTMMASSSRIIRCSSASARSASVIVSFISGPFSNHDQMRDRSKSRVSAASVTARQGHGKDRAMTRHFGVLIPSTNTTVEMECRLLPPAYQAHIGRLMTSAPGRTFSPSRDEDIDHQSRLLGTAKVELVILAQTSASLFADDYDDVVTQRMSAGAGVPAITSAQAVGRALRALRARRIAIVSPYSDAVNNRAARYFETRYGLEAAALEG